MGVGVGTGVGSGVGVGVAVGEGDGAGWRGRGHPESSRDANNTPTEKVANGRKPWHAVGCCDGSIGRAGLAGYRLYQARSVTTSEAAAKITERRICGLISP